MTTRAKTYAKGIHVVNFWEVVAVDQREFYFDDEKLEFQKVYLVQHYQTREPGSSIVSTGIHAVF